MKEGHTLYQLNDTDGQPYGLLSTNAPKAEVVELFGITYRSTPEDYSELPENERQICIQAEDNGDAVEALADILSARGYEAERVYVEEIGPFDDEEE